MSFFAGGGDVFFGYNCKSYYDFKSLYIFCYFDELGIA